MSEEQAARWQQVKEIFGRAVGLPDEECHAFVARACSGDDVVRAEVERLLTAHRDAGGFIERSPVSLIGRRITRYEIVRRIGAGGMGEVYLARDPDLGRDVALKIGTSPDAAGRLRREAQQASRLNHPHICTIHEVGITDGQWFIAMEYVDGRPLAEVIPAGGLPLEQLLEYARQIASALSHAHAHGVIHCDLKAANIVVTPDGRSKVLDFGLARRAPGIGGGEGDVSSVTVEGVMAGTLSCMAPELLRGQSPDIRSDIWSLGVLLHRMAAGAPPFAGATDFELSAAILHEPPATLPGQAPLALREIIGRCLAKSPDDRYQNAGAVLAALGRLDPVARNPSRRAVLRAVAAMAAAIAAVAMWRFSTPSEPVAVGASGRPALAVLPFDAAGIDADRAWLATGIQSMLVTGLAQTPGLDIVSLQRLHEARRETGAGPIETRDRGVSADAARAAGAGATVVGSVFGDGGSVRIDVRVEDLETGRVLTATSVRGTDLFLLVDTLAARIRDGVGTSGGEIRPVTQVSTSSLDAYRSYAQGVDAWLNYRLDAAQRLLEEAVAADPAFAEAYLQLALVSGPAGRPSARSGYLRKAAEHAARLSGRRRLLMEVELARDQGRYVDAARGLDRLQAEYPDVEEISTLAAQLYTPVFGPLADSSRLLAVTTAAVAANPRSTLARNNHGYALARALRFDEAIAEFATYAQLAPREPNPYDSLGEVYLLMGDPGKALETYARALTIDPGFTYSRRGRAWTLGILGRLDEALAERDAPLHLRATLLARAGRYRESDEALALARDAAARDGDPVRLAGLHLLSALTALERGNMARAVDANRQAAAVLDPVAARRKRFSLHQVALVDGVAEVRRGRLAAARAQLDTLRGLTVPDDDAWWVPALEGEIALASGDVEGAAQAFARAAPASKQFQSSLVEGSVLSNDLVFRDGLARAARARGDWRAATDVYRQLLAYDARQRWVAIFEPRYVLEIARLLDQQGDHAAARAEYERFLRLWARADPELPEPDAARRALRRLAAANP